jgi:hypothetical protein
LVCCLWRGMLCVFAIISTVLCSKPSISLDPR